MDKEKLDDSGSSSPTGPAEFYDPTKESRWTRIGLSLESFKRAPGSTGYAKFFLQVKSTNPPNFRGQIIAGNLSEEEMAKLRAEGPLLQQKMKRRHVAMMGVGGSIGTGLFVGSGQALHNGGPAGLIIAWILIGCMLISVTQIGQALGEMAIVYPVSGGFYTLANRFLDPGFAFAMGWNYVLLWIVTVPLEITVAATTVQYWGDSVPTAGLITIFWVALIIISLFGTLGYAEEEFWGACLKLLIVVMFVIIGIVCLCGGGPSGGDFDHYVGGLHWQNPGAFAHGFHGVCTVFVTAAFAFAGTEIIGLAASETPNPRKTMPSAVKAAFWRIILIYIVSLTIVGLMVPYDDDRLLGGSGSAASPFVIALDRAKIPGVNHLVNATICVSVLSIGLSSIYAGSRTLTALAETGYAPKLFTYVDKSSRPLFSVIFLVLCGPIAYARTAKNGDTVFDWLVAISGLSTLVTWMSICVCHLRFRKAWRVQGHSIEELPYRAAAGIYGSIFGIILVVLVLIAQFYVALWPIGFDGTGSERAQSFFKAYMAVPIILLFWVVGYAWKKTKPKRSHEIDLDTGRKSFYTVEEMRAVRDTLIFEFDLRYIDAFFPQYRAERRKAPWYTRLFRLMFTD
ncbi:Amino-acid permease inda1 [Marasmius crinis-equi]|uniref:Amino-acid permease inda1 n=1 Tax=Marasmius crinis-equi TaxID=585013 RepID=A0ABR3F6Q4_9AGAR